MKRFAVPALKLLVIGLLVWYMAHTIRSGDLHLEKLQGIREHWPWMLLAQLFSGGALVLTFWRFRLLLLAQGIRYSLREAVALGFVGFFFNQFTPGSTGGDLVKAFYVAMEHRERRAAGVTTVFLDRIVGVLALVALAAISALFNRDRIASSEALSYLAFVIAGLLAGTLLGASIFFSGRVRRSAIVQAIARKIPFRKLVMQVQGSIYLYRHHPGLVLAVLGISLLVQLCLVGMVYSFARALGENAVQLGAFFFVVPLGMLAMAIPTGSPGGLGQSEFAFDTLFRQASGYPYGFLLALLHRLSWYAWALLGLIPYLRRRKRVDEARRLVAEENAEKEKSDAETAGRACRADDRV